MIFERGGSRIQVTVADPEFFFGGAKVKKKQKSWCVFFY
jgi:hypothetical protein